jgi:CRISPR associated protein Cas1
MSYRERRNTAVLLTCVRCGSTFHPFKRRETKAHYCSRACATAYSRERMAAARAAGQDPAHGGAVTEKRRAAIAQRRASGEMVGRQPSMARTDSRTVPAQHEAQTTQAAADVASNLSLIPLPASLTPEERIQRDALGYLAAGNRYEGLTAKLLTAERVRGDGRTLILAGYGAGLRIGRDALIVTEGHTHYPQTPLVHTLYRGVHDVERIVCLNPQGSLSFPAVQWCAAQGITIVLLDRSGSLLSTLTSDATADAALRRRQYFAQATGHDVPICQELLRRKLAAQRATLVHHPELPGQAHALDVLDTALAWLSLPELPRGSCPWTWYGRTRRAPRGRTSRRGTIGHYGGTRRTPSGCHRTGRQRGTVHHPWHPAATPGVRLTRSTPC